MRYLYYGFICLRNYKTVVHRPINRDDKNVNVYKSVTRNPSTNGGFLSPKIFKKLVTSFYWRAAKIRERDKDHIFTIAIVHRNAAYIIFQIKENFHGLLRTQIEKEKYSTLAINYIITEIIIVYSSYICYTILPLLLDL